MRFLLKYPSRARPHLFMKTVDNWTSLASGQNELHWLATFHDDDQTMKTDDIRQFCESRGIEYHYVPAKNKTENYIAKIGDTSFVWDAVLLISDDMKCLRKNWDAVIEHDFANCYDFAIWYPDGIQPRVNTLAVCGRGAYDKYLNGVLYDPRFESVYQDSYYQLLLQREGALKQIKLPDDDLLFRHEWKIENNDELMQQTEARDVYERDRETFERLKKGLGD
jgi:hypothetical protein